jgi:hypothetical protein
MNDEQPRTRDGGSEAASIRRRPVLLAGTGIFAGSLSGCLGGGGESSGDESGGSDSDTPASITVPGGATCDVCGMTIRQHPGPSAEIFYAEQGREGHENPAGFDSAWEAYQ